MDNELYIKVKADTEEAEKGLGNIEESAKNMSASIEEDGKKVDDALNSMSIASQKAGIQMQKLKNEISKLDSDISLYNERIANWKEFIDKGADSNGYFADMLDKDSQHVKDLSLKSEELKIKLHEMSLKQDEASNVASKHDSIMVKMLGGQDKYKTIISQLPEPISKAINGIEGMTGAARTFIATPLGAIIAALVLALSSLKSWLTSTVEGEMEMAKISGYLSGFLDQLKEIAINVGKALFDAFDNPKKALSDFADYYKEYFINILTGSLVTIEGVRDALAGIFTFNWDKASKGGQTIVDGMIQQVTGVKGGTSKIGSWFASTSEKAEENAQIAVEERNLEIARSKWSLELEKLNKIKAESMQAMYNTSASSSARKKALEEYKKVVETIKENELSLADKAVELQQRRMKLTSNSIEDENKLRELQRQRLQVETQASMALASLQRRSNGINKLDKKTDKTNTDDTKEFLKLQQKNQEEEIKLMDEGYEKKLSQIKLAYQKEYNALREQEQKWRNSQNGVLTAEQADVLSKSFEIARKKRDKDSSLLSEEEINKALQGIESYEQKRAKIQEDYEKKRKSLFIGGDENFGLKGGVTNDNLSELKRQLDDSLAAVDEEFASRETEFQIWANSIADMSLAQLQDMLAKAKSELASMERYEEKDSNKMATARAKVAKAQEAINKANASRTKMGVEPRAIKEWEDLYKTLGQCSKEFQEIGDEIGGVAGEILKSAGEIATNVVGMINSIVQLVEMSSASMAATSETASKAVKTVEKASVILAVISAALAVATKISELFNNDDAKQERIDALQREIENLQWMIDNQEILRVWEEYGNAVDRARNSYEEFLKEYYNSLVANNKMSVLAFGQKDAELFEKAIGRTAKKMADFYAEMDYSTDKDIGGKRYEEARNQLEMYSEQQLKLYEQIEQEESKKDTNWDFIEDAKKQIEENEQAMRELIDGLVEDIIGGSAKDIAQELSDAFFEAFKNGEDYAEAWGKKVEDITTDIIRNMLKQQLLEQPIAEIIDNYKKRWFPNGEFQGFDAVINSMIDFENDLNAVSEMYNGVIGNLPEELQKRFESTASLTATSKGIATASQNSVDELNGRMTAVQSHTYSISENTKLLVSTTQEILRSVRNIDSNTSRLESIEKDGKAVRSMLEDINSKGIKMR